MQSKYFHGLERCSAFIKGAILYLGDAPNWVICRTAGVHQAIPFFKYPQVRTLIGLWLPPAILEYGLCSWDNGAANWDGPSRTCANIWTMVNNWLLITNYCSDNFSLYRTFVLLYCVATFVSLLKGQLFGNLRTYHRYFKVNPWKQCWVRRHLMSCKET